MNPVFAVLRNNRNFRLLFIGQAISQLGDWFNSVAVLALLLELTGSATAVAWLTITQFLPTAVIGPIAGVVVDRVDRKRLMVGMDVLRGLVVLGLLFVRHRDQVWLIYVIMALTVGAAAFFEPARTATIPNVTTKDELMEAAALSSATWSAMLAIGAGVGGLAMALFGRDGAFILNGLSFFVSAIFISRTQFRDPPRGGPRATNLAALTGVTELLEGFRYVRSRSHVAALMSVKAGWGLAGGILLLLAIFGERVFPVAGSAAAGIGIMYGARGIGAGLGPILLRWILGTDPAKLRRAIGPAYFIVGVFYMLLGWAPNLAIAALCVLCAHLGGSILWTFSTVLLQIEVPDQFRGRVFSAELALMTLTLSASSYWTAFELDHGGWSPRLMSFALGVMFCLPGMLWLVILSRWTDTGEPPNPVSPIPSSEEEALESRIG